MIGLLNNVFWHALHGPQAHFAEGGNHARRFAAGFSPIVGFADPQQPDFHDLAPYCAVGESFYCDGWSGVAPPGWQVTVDTHMHKMLWDGGLPESDEAPDAVLLGKENVAQAVELAALCRPGPFGPRTIELGEYFGLFDKGRLIAMAGERTTAGPLREISGVCTHPDYQGLGMARRLMRKLIRRQILRKEIPFLHVVVDKVAAHALYKRMGFVDYRVSVVRVITRC